MKNITAQYQLLKEGKMSKDAFVRSARISFPQYISSVTSYKDAVSILKGKRLLSEMDDVKPSKEEIIAQFLQDKGMTYEPDELDYKDAQELEKRMADAGYEADFDLGGDFAEEEEFFEAKDKKQSINEVKDNSGYTYIQDKPVVPQIDLVNPYQLKKGVEEELSKMSDLSGDAYFVALDRALKAMTKDPNKFRDLQFANYKDVKKADEELQMTEVGKKSKTKAKTDSAGYVKKPVKKDEAANVSVKKENKKGKPQGVKEMTNKPKTAKGISKTMELPGKEQVLKSLKEHLAKKKAELNEDMHHDYTMGMEVHTPSGVGKVSEIVGSTITVEMHNGARQDFQVNVLNKQKEVHHEQPYVETSEEQPKTGITKEQVMNKLKEFFSKKKKKTEAMDVVKAKSQDGDDVVVGTYTAGQGKAQAGKLKSKGITSATSQTLK